MSESDHPRNGSRNSWHDAEALDLAQQAFGLASEVANRQAADRGLLDRIDDNVDELRKSTARIEKAAGNIRTDIDRNHRALLNVTNRIFALQWTKVYWPLIAALFSGSFVAYVVVHVLAH